MTCRDSSNRIEVESVMTTMIASNRFDTIVGPLDVAPGLHNPARMVHVCLHPFAVGLVCHSTFLLRWRVASYFPYTHLIQNASSVPT